MKKLLLTTAIVAVAGGAMAEITWTGTAEVGYKDFYKATEAGNDANGNKVFTDAGDYPAIDYNKDGDKNDPLGVYLLKTQNISPIYYEGGINATASADLGNGVTASLNYGFKLADPGTTGTISNNGSAAILSDLGYPTLKVEAPVGNMIVGKTDHAAHAYVTTPYESLVGFGEGKKDLVMRGDITVSGIQAGVSYVLADRADDAGMPEGLNKDSYTAGIKGNFSGFAFAVGSQLNKNAASKATANSIGGLGNTYASGVSVGYNAMGIDAGVYVGQGYDGGSNATLQTVGVTASYTMSNGVKLGGSYAVNQGNGIKDSTGKKGVVLNHKGVAKSQYASYKVWAGFNAMGADITLGYKNKNDVYSAYTNKTKELGNAGMYFDAAYTIEGTGVKLIGGYDATKAVTQFTDYQKWQWTIKNKPRELWGAYYVGAYYDVAENAKLKATYSNGTDANPAEDIKPGTTLSVALSF